MCRYETESAAFEASKYLPTLKPLADVQELNVQPESVISEITEMHMDACWGFAKRHLNNPQMARRGNALVGWNSHWTFWPQLLRERLEGTERGDDWATPCQPSFHSSIQLGLGQISTVWNKKLAWWSNCYVSQPDWGSCIRSAALNHFQKDMDFFCSFFYKSKDKTMFFFLYCLILLSIKMLFE